MWILFVGRKTRLWDYVLFAYSSLLETCRMTEASRIGDAMELPRGRVTPDDLHGAGVPIVIAEFLYLDSARLHGFANLA